MSGHLHDDERSEILTHKLFLYRVLTYFKIQYRFFMYVNVHQNIIFNFLDYIYQKFSLNKGSVFHIRKQTFYSVYSVF